MSRVLSIITGAIATWRIAHMLLLENGPWRVFRRAREALGVVYWDGTDDNTAVQDYKYEITVCIWCLSMWVGGIVAAITALHPRAYALFIPYVYSAIAVMLDKHFGMGRKG